MSCHVIYYEDGAKKMRPVLTAAEYRNLRNTTKQQAIVSCIRQGDCRMKQRLVQMNYSCLPHADGTLKGSTTPSTSVGMDVDHIEPSELQAVRERILTKKDELGLLMLELSARGSGFHLVFRRRPELTQEENLHWASNLLGVTFDSGAKDITRVFFTTTASTGDLLFLDDDLFNVEAAGMLPPAGENAQKANPQRESPQEASPQRENQPAAGTRTFAEAYDGVPYPLLIEALESQLGGVPAHGSRNQFIFAMACHLRYVCDDDPQWIAAVLPTYGEATDKWMSTIRSACNRSQNKTMPKLLRTAIEQARCRSAQDDSQEVEATDGSGNGTLPPPMPAKLPPLIKLLVSKTPEIYRPAVAHAVFPALAAHPWRTRFKYIDNVEHEATLMNVLMAGTSAGKNCISEPIRFIMADIVERDQINREKERQWKEEMVTKGSNKDKKRRPEGLIIQSVKPDMTNAAFVQRTKEAEEHFLYTQMNEIDQFDALKTSVRSKAQFQIMCLAFDPQNSYGTERVGTASVSETVCVRFNWNASTTIQKGKAYFAKVLTDGPISRINFCTIPERPIGSEMPIYGTYDEHFQAELKPYIDRLNAARGLVECPRATALARKLMEENAEFARLSQSRVYENLSFRANVIAYLKAMVLYVAQGEKWDKTIEDFIRWSERYDLWCKMKFFGEAIEDAECATSSSHRPGPQNLLALLPEQFTTDELQQVRRRQGVDRTPLQHMLTVWKSRGYISPVDGQENCWRNLRK